MTHAFAEGTLWAAPLSATAASAAATPPASGLPGHGATLLQDTKPREKVLSPPQTRWHFSFREASRRVLCLLVLIREMAGFSWDIKCGGIWTSGIGGGCTRRKRDG